MMRHVGKLASTDSKCVVIMMQIPGDPEHALIVESDALPDLYHQNLMDVLESKEGQANPILANILGTRHMYLEGIGNKSIMEALHLGKFLRPIGVDQVYMMPSPGQAHSLKDILLQQGALNESIDPELAGDDPNAAAAEKFNPMAHNKNAMLEEDMLGTAKGYLVQADLLQSEANAMREKAYGVAPSLRPELIPTRRASTKAKTPAKKVAVKKAPAKRGRPKKVAV